jgi:magnesium chelatase family protein
MVSRYLKRIPGLFLDRIDIHIEVPWVEYEKLHDGRPRESSAAIRTRVEAARFEGMQPLANADMGLGEVREYYLPGNAGKSLLKAAIQQLHMSTQAIHRLLKMARTIADLERSDETLKVRLIETPESGSRHQLSGNASSLELVQSGENAHWRRSSRSR